MRPKIVITILASALGVLLIAIVFSKTSSKQTTIGSVTNNAVSHVIPATPPSLAAKLTPAPIVTNSTTSNAPLSPQDHESYVLERTTELDALAMQTNSQAHEKIVDELENSDKDIRKAALEAIQQANDRTVVPRMRQIANQTIDDSERQAILDAIDYINLPSLTEYLQRKSKKTSSGN